MLHIERQAVMEVLLQTFVNNFDTDDQIGMKNVSMFNWFISLCILFQFAFLSTCSYWRVLKISTA